MFRPRLRLFVPWRLAAVVMGKCSRTPALVDEDDVGLDDEVA
jgi:hypothetical protein